MAEAGINWDDMIEENKAIIRSLVPNPTVFDLEEYKQDLPISEDERTFAQLIRNSRSKLNYIVGILLVKLEGHQFRPVLKGGTAYNSYATFLRQSLLFDIPDINRYVPLTVDYDISIGAEDISRFDILERLLIDNVYDELNTHFTRHGIYSGFSPIPEHPTMEKNVEILKPLKHNDMLMLSVVRGGGYENNNYRFSLALPSGYMEPLIEIIITTNMEEIHKINKIKDLVITETIDQMQVLYYHTVPDIESLIKLSLRSFINRNIRQLTTKCMKDFYKMNYLFNILLVLIDSVNIIIDISRHELERLFNLFKYIAVVINKCSPIFLYYGGVSGIELTLKSIINSEDDTMILKYHNDVKKQLQSLRQPSAVPVVTYEPPAIHESSYSVKPPAMHEPPAKQVSKPSYVDVIKAISSSTSVPKLAPVSKAPKAIPLVLSSTSAPKALPLVPEEQSSLPKLKDTKSFNVPPVSTPTPKVVPVSILPVYTPAAEALPVKKPKLKKPKAKLGSVRLTEHSSLNVPEPKPEMLPPSPKSQEENPSNVSLPRKTPCDNCVIAKKYDKLKNIAKLK